MRTVHLRTPGEASLLRRIVAALAAAAVLLAGALAAPAAVAAVPVAEDGELTGIDVAVDSGSVLANGQRRVQVVGTNTSGSDLYNASVVAVLPVGVTYVSGTAQPGPPNDVGEPQIQTWIPDPAQPERTAQVLVWANAADLPNGAKVDVSFEVWPDAEEYPVGSDFMTDAGVYANSNERLVPRVQVPENGGAPVVSRATAGGDAGEQTSVAAIELTKTNTDPENEVYRGQANTTRYVLRVTTADEAGSDGVVVTDLLPASFQVTDCAVGEVACTTEVVDIDGVVYTRLTWNLGDVDAGTTVELAYDAFVGLREITAPDGVADGAATRPGPSGTGVENTARVDGVYTGAVAEGTSAAVSATDTASVLVLDLGVVKSVTPSRFTAGSTARYSLAVRTSEDIVSEDVVLVDTLPDGMCPVVPSGVPTTGTWPQECPQPGTVATDITGGEMTQATANADGTFTLTFTVPGSALAPDEDAVVAYDAYMRASYTDGARTAIGDDLVNLVTVSGVTSPAAGNTVDTGEVDSTNDSSAALSTADLQMTKTVWSNPDRTPISAVSGAGATCADADSSEYVADGPVLQLGDLVCFRIRIDFADGVSAREPVLTDFLPPGTELVDWAEGPGNTTTVTEEEPTQWALGTPSPDGSLYVPANAVLVLDLLVQVNAVPDADADIDLTGNLAKLRYIAGDGSVLAARSEAGIGLAPVPPVSLTKKVEGVDRLQTREDESLSFTIDLVHEGSDSAGNDYPLDTVSVWDALPDGFTCADVADVTPTASCAVSGTGPTDGQTVLIWELTTAELGGAGLVPGQSMTLSYELTVPSPLSIATEYTNTAAVTRYTTETTDGRPASSSTVEFFPENPFDAYPDATINAPEASDTAVLVLPDAAVDKAVVATGENVAGDDALGQATIGESVDYEYTVTIPARTSVFDGVLTDILPSGGRLVAAGDATVASAPAGVTVYDDCRVDSDAFVLCADGTLTFPESWTNATDADADFVISLPVRVADVDANEHGTDLVNTAVLRSAATVGGALLERDRATASVEVVEPAPTLTKTASSSSVAGGQVVTYTLQAANQDGRPPLYDVVVVDCVPGELTIDTLAPGIAGPVAGDGDNGCAAGTQRLEWALADPLVAGEPQNVTYTVVVPENAAAGWRYTNTAALTGASLSTGDARTTYASDTSARIEVTRPGVTKTSSRAVTVPGQEVTWTVTATIPANVELADAAFVDAIPAEFGSSAAADATWTLTCTDGDTAWQTTCVDPTTLTASPGTAFGLLLGNIDPASEARTLTLALTTTLPADTTASQGATLTNDVQLRWNYEQAGTTPTSTADSWDTDQSATATTQVRHPAVTVAKSVDDSTPQQTQVVTYRVTATASAGSRNVPAYNVVVVDEVPAGLIVLDEDGDPITDGAQVASGGVWDESARTLTWGIDELSPGTASAVSFTYPARLEDAASLSGDPLVNTVRAQSWTSLETDGRSYGPGAQATRSVTPQFPRIDVTKVQVSPENPVYLGQEVLFRIQAANGGGATAATFDLSDVLPQNWTYVADSAEVTVRSEDAVAVEPSIDGQTLTWATIGGTVDLAPGDEVVVTYRAVPGEDAATGTDVAHTNTATAAQVTDLAGGTSYDGGSYIGTEGEATARIAAADLRLQKTANDDFVAGQTGTYTVTVTNDGDDAAVGVRVVDTVTEVDGTSVVGAAGDGWSCGDPGADGEIACVRTDPAEELPAGESWSLTVSVAVDADVADGTEIPNTATVGARTDDPDSENNTDEDTATVAAEADLRVSKIATEQSVVAGERIEWIVSLTNAGPSLSRGTSEAPIVLTDPLPAQVGEAEIVSASDGVVCELADDVVSCDVPFDLAVGDTVTVRVAGIVDPSVAAESDIVNTATVTSVTSDPEPENDEATSTVPTEVSEELTIAKTVVGDDDPVAGETLTYRISVRNAGPSDARGVFVEDALPTGLTFRELTSESGTWTHSAADGTERFDLDEDLAPGTDAAFLIVADVDAAVEGDLENTAVVSSAWRADQDTSTVSTGSATSADLALTKTVDRERVIAGSDQTPVYTIAVDNLGPSDAAGPVTVTDLLPRGMTLSGQAPADCAVEDQGGRQQLTCLKTDGLDVAEDPWEIEVPVAIAADVLSSTLANTATVSSATPDENPDNDTDSVDLGIDQRAALRVDKQAPDDAVAGESAVWTITVANDGPSDAQNVVLTDDLPAELRFVSATSESDAVTCTGGTEPSCAVGTLAAGAEVTVSLTTTVLSATAADTEIRNAAIARSTTLDPETEQPAAASDDDTVQVRTESALTIEKTGPATADAGSTIVFALAVGNTGPSDAVVTVRDTLPEGMAFLSASTLGGPAVWECAPQDGDVVCGLDAALVAGAQAPVLQLAVMLDADLSAGELTNTATVSAPSAPETATDTAEVGIQTHADLEVVKTHDPDALAVAGESFTWTMEVVNHGPSVSVATDEQPVVVQDVLPAGVTFVEGDSCTVVGDEDGRQVVECALTESLAVDGTHAFTVEGALAEDLSGQIENAAVVRAGVTPQPEDQVWPDEDTDTVEVLEFADLVVTKRPNGSAAGAGVGMWWTIEVENLGPSNSDADADHPITVVDLLPAGVTAASGSGEGWECSTTSQGGRERVECTYAADLAVGDAASLQVGVDVPADMRGELVNVASVTPGLTPGRDGPPAESSTTTPIRANADLMLSKTIPRDLVAGGTGVYRLGVANLGYATADDVVITDQLPEGVRFASAEGEGWSCADDGEQVVCRLAEPLAPDGRFIHVDLTVDVALDIADDVVNTASVTSSTPDPDLENNSASVTGRVGEAADLAIVKRSVGEPRVGEAFGYTLTVENRGPSVARDVVISDRLPDQLRLDGAPEGCSAAGGLVTCVRDELAPGETVEVEIAVTVLPDAYPAVSNTATVSSGTLELTPEDNASTVTDVVPATSALTITKDVSPLTQNETAEYTITVGNDGPTDDPGPVTVTDTLPDGVSLRSITLDGESWECATQGQRVVCDIGAVAVGQERVLVIEVLVTGTGTIVNTAEVSSDASASARAQATGVVGLATTGAVPAELWPVAVLLLGLGALLLIARRHRREISA